MQGIGPADPETGRNETLFLATIPMGIATDPEVTAGHQIRWQGIGAWSGMVIKNDPGQPIIWIAFALLIAGLVLTFYFPRRRAWARVTRDHVEIAFVADRYVDSDREFERLLKAVDEAGVVRSGTTPGAEG
jgi:cytochrome c biogenesis protein ResB